MVQLGGAEVKCLAQNSKGQLFAGTWYDGVFRSTNDGNSWTGFDSGLSYLNFQSLVVDEDGYVYAGSSGHGVFRTSLSTPVEEVARGVPHGYEMSQNYPNPFNPTTAISYRLSAVGHVTLRVYDVLGREVATLVNSRQTAGEHSVVFDSRNLSSGVYIYELTANNFISVKKMLMLK